MPRYNTDSVAPAAGVHASVEDLAKWLRLQLGDGRIRGQADLQSAQLPGRCGRRRPRSGLAGDPGTPSPTHLRAYALGWFVSDYHGRLRVEHDGSIDGMFSKVVLLPELEGRRGRA